MEATITDLYPDHPGAKGIDGTSQDAADDIAASVPHLRRTALMSLARLGRAPALAIVAGTNLTREAILPRISELRRLGLVEPTGERRQNPSGKWAAVLTLTANAHALISGGAI